MLEDTLWEFERATGSIAGAEIEETSWRPLRKHVIDLIERGNATVALVDGTHSDSWTAIQWDETDAPVMLARAFGRSHSRLAAALDKIEQASPHIVVEPAVGGGEHQAAWDDHQEITSDILTAYTQLRTPVPA